MSTITKERIELFIKSPLENGLTRGEQMELARIALASLEAEPVAYIFKHPAGKLFWALTDESNKDQSDVIPVYAAPPVPVVPEEKPMPNPLKMYAVDAVAAIAEVRGWNSCRAAMLQGKSEQPQNAQQNIPENIPGGNSPVSPGGWISCSERMPVIGELNWRTSFPLLITCEIGVIPAYYGFVSVNGNKHYGFMESLKYGDDNGNHPQTNEYGLISNVTHWMPLPEPPL
ncbi:putative phage protein [Escherichia coli]|nr:putative phage protein [Escherichia coli]GCR95502.1 putative phage protein [Escherichia coli]